MFFLSQFLRVFRLQVPNKTCVPKDENPVECASRVDNDQPWCPYNTKFNITCATTLVPDCGPDSYYDPISCEAIGSVPGAYCIYSAEMAGTTLLACRADPDPNLPKVQGRYPCWGAGQTQTPEISRWVV